MIDLLKGYFKKCLLVSLTLFTPIGGVLALISAIIDNDVLLAISCFLGSFIISLLLALILYLAAKKEEKIRFVKITNNLMLMYDEKFNIVEEKEFIDISFRNNYFNWMLTFLFDYMIPKSLIVTLPDKTELKLGHLFKKDYNKFIINENIINN